MRAVILATLVFAAAWEAGGEARHEEAHSHEPEKGSDGGGGG